MSSKLRSLAASLLALAAPICGFGWTPLYQTDAGAPVTWQQPASIPMVCNFRALADPEGTTWTVLSAEGMASWNANMKNAQISAVESTGTGGTRDNGLNEMFFAESAFGFEFGEARSVSFVAEENDKIVEADVVFSASYEWTTSSFRVAATHELGHVLGLGHPDEAGQTVSAVMNSAIGTSSTLTADDIAGIQALYQAPPQFPEAPTITTQPASFSALLGGSVTFSVTATGYPLPTLQWVKDGNEISGATSAALALTNLKKSDAGLYHIVATNSEGTATSTAATLTINTPPTIVSAPVARIVPAGETVTFSVTAEGDTPLAYQWAFNGVSIAGATTSSYAVSASESTVGTYRVLVTNSFGSASASATLAIQQPFSAPAITTQPADLTVNAGSTATFTVVATGFPLPLCQWQKDGVLIPDATGTTLTLPNVKATQSGNYRAVLTNSSGSVTSDTAILIVNTQAPAITTQPADASAIAGETVELSVTATGYPAPSYQWRKDGKALEGATGATLAFDPVRTSDAGTYSVVVFNDHGSVTSGAARLAVGLAPAAPTIVETPVDRTVSLGGSVLLKVVATGFPTPAYQWYRNGALLAGATGSTLLITNAKADDAGAYTVNVSNSSGGLRSAPANLTVSADPAAPRISSQPESLSLPVGAKATFSVVADGLPAPTYQWSKNGTAIAGAKSATLVIASVGTNDAGDYTVLVSNEHGDLLSAVASLEVNTAPTIVTQPISRTVAAGTTVAFLVEATGHPAPTYQWRRAGVNIEGATEPTLTIADTQPKDAGNYQVVVTNTSGTVTSNSVALIVQTAPSITTEPADRSVLVGTTVNFTVVAEGTMPLSYQWYINGAIAEGHTGPSFGAFAADGYHNGYTFKCLITNALGFATTRTVNLRVDIPTAPTITTQPVDLVRQVGESADFAIEAAGVPDPTYQWYLNDEIAEGHTEASFGAFTVDGFHDRYTFRCVVSNGSGSVSSRKATLYVGAISAPEVISEPQDLEALIGTSADFVAEFSGLPAPTYQWYVNGVLADGRTSARFGAFTVEGYHNGYTFHCVATNSAGTQTTRTATLAAGKATAPTVTTQPATRTARIGETVDFEVVATGFPSPTYQWYLNGSPLAGHTSAKFGAFTVDGFHDGWTFRCVVTNASGSVTSETATLHVAFLPEVTPRATGITATDGQPASLMVDATGATRFQWFRGGILVADQPFHGGVLLGGSHVATLDIPSMTPAQAGLYDCMVSGPGGDTLSAPIVLGVIPAAGQRTAGSVATRDEWQNIQHANGNVFDQFLLAGSAGTFTADAGQIARMSYLDENGSIVQVELFGSGAITVVLDGATGPMAPALYNQSGIQYMKGKATVILAGADETTHFTIYSVGTATNPGVTKTDVDYVGWADVAASGIVSTNGKLGGIHQGNVAYNSDLGPTGIYAPSVLTAASLVVVHGMAASDTAQSYLQFGPGGTVEVKIAGSALAQPNDAGIIVDGLSRVLAGAGQDSCGRDAPALPLVTTLFSPDGDDVTSSLVVPVAPPNVGTEGLPPETVVVPEQ